MWTLVAPLLSQSAKSLQLSKGRLLGIGAAALGFQARASKRTPLVFTPLKDVEVFALQQLS